MQARCFELILRYFAPILGGGFPKKKCNLQHAIHNVHCKRFILSHFHIMCVRDLVSKQQANELRLMDVYLCHIVIKKPSRHINLPIKRNIMALTQRRWCTFKWLWHVKANKCPVLAHTHQNSFTAVSVHTVSEIHPWGDHRAQLKAQENLPQEINSKMSEELSVGKDTLVITTFQIYLQCSPITQHPQDEPHFPTVKNCLVSLHKITIILFFFWSDINEAEIIVWFLPNS